MKQRDPNELFDLVWLAVRHGIRGMGGATRDEQLKKESPWVLDAAQICCV
jgi:hypothetical protein